MKDFKHLGANERREPVTLTDLVVVLFIVIFAPIVVGFGAGIMFALLRVGFVGGVDIMSAILKWLAL